MTKFSIYRWTNQINGKIYIGLTNNAEGRKYAHLRSAARGSKLPIHQALRKYGVGNFSFEVIFHAFDEKDLPDYERYFIKEYNCCRLDGDVKGYNVTRGVRDSTPIMPGR